MIEVEERTGSTTTKMYPSTMYRWHHGEITADARPEDLFDDSFPGFRRRMSCISVVDAGTPGPVQRGQSLSHARFHDRGVVRDASLLVLRFTSMCARQCCERDGDWTLRYERTCKV